MIEGYLHPIAIHRFAMKVSCPPQCANPHDRDGCQCREVFSEVAKIPAHISNLEVHRQPQG